MEVRNKHVSVVFKAKNESNKDEKTEINLGIILQQFDLLQFT